MTDPQSTVYHGDCMEVLKTLPDCSVNCCITSPPYFNLRDYSVAGQIGLEKTPDKYVQKLVAVFREVRRVLRDDGTCWVNLGDSYCAQGNRTGDNGYNDGRANRQKRFNAPTPLGLKPKDLIGIPWRFAFAAQADGWYLRQDIIWSKPNPMPESVTDRCTKAHEYIFLLSKNARYYYDNEAISEEQTSNENGGFTNKETLKTVLQNQSHAPSLINAVNDGKRNRRSVWTVTTKPLKEAHFAAFPEDLVEPMIKAGCPVGGTVLDPFFGSGTTGRVAIRLQREYIGIELNEIYVNEIISKRTKNVQQEMFV